MPSIAPPPVASTKHSLILLTVLLGIALAGFVALRGAVPAGGGGSSGGGGSAGLYLSLIAAEGGLFALVRAGVRAHGGLLASIVSERPLTARTLATDLLLGAFLLGVLLVTEQLLSGMFGVGNRALVGKLLVRDASLMPLWVALAVSAGFVEELTFRGYLQRQFGAWTGNRWLGVALQAVLFGVTHGYQGGALIARITVLGLLFGVVALVRRSLIPGIAAHTALDVIGGLQLLR